MHNLGAAGESNWLEGVMLLLAYCIICFAFFFYEPEGNPYGRPT